MDYIEYPYVLVAKGKPQTLFSAKDYEDILREYIGEDAVQFFRQSTEGAEDKIKDLENALDDCEAALDECYLAEQRGQR